MNPADRQRLQQILATFDEAGLVALANKGLVRRAQKDYETGGLSWEETETHILVRGPDWTVTMPATGPADARDDTQATGITRQILTATMYLRDQLNSAVSVAVEAPAQASAIGESTSETAAVVVTPAPVAAENPDLEPAQKALLELTLDDLVKWAGRTIVGDALALMRTRPPFEVERGFGLTIRFPQHETEVRIIPKAWGKSVAALLDQFLANTPKAFRRQWVVVAVVALRAEAGLPELSLDDAATKEAAIDLQSRQQVLATASDLLEGLVRTGLAHPSERMVQRLFTLSVSATGSHLPRLSRGLRAIADEVELILQRDAKGHSDRLFDQLCVSHALVMALRKGADRPAIDLVGRHRTEYESVGDLNLAGAGAFPWRTASGFEGVTGLFWDAQGDRFWTWTESRPSEGPGRFNLENVYQATAPWTDGPALGVLCRRSFTLKSAKANPQGRLSGSQETTVTAMSTDGWPPAGFGSHEFSDWRALASHAQRIHPMGLRLPDPLERIVVLRPKVWGERVFDETHQRLVWPVFDENGLPLQLIVRWEETNEASIAFLESAKTDRDKLTGVIGRVELHSRELIVEPLALLSDGTPRGDRLLNPGFDQQRIEVKQLSLLERLRAKFGRGKVATTIAVDDDETLALDDASFPPAIERRLADLEGRLLRLAETGIHQLDDLHRQQLTELGRNLDRTGLDQLSVGTLQLVDSATPAHLLWCRYLCRLHREAAAAAAVSSHVGLLIDVTPD